MSTSKGTKIAIAAFVKTRGLSPLKTRLANGIGKERAEEFFTLSIECIREIFRELREQDSRIVPIWSVAEPKALNHETWQDFDRCLQGVGTLGERLAHVFRELFERYDIVIFIGGDSPQLRPQVFLETISALQEGKDFVLGPTEDGGYYLFAARKDIPHSVWVDTPYSAANTYTEFKRRLDVLGLVRELKEDFDVDEVSDLSRLKFHLKKILEKPEELEESISVQNKSKQNLLQWLESSSVNLSSL